MRQALAYRLVVTAEWGLGVTGSCQRLPFCFGHRCVNRSGGRCLCLRRLRMFGQRVCIRMRVSDAQFWAVGLDCCDSTGGFACDQAAVSRPHDCGGRAGGALMRPRWVASL